MMKTLCNELVKCAEKQINKYMKQIGYHSAVTYRLDNNVRSVRLNI